MSRKEKLFLINLAFVLIGGAFLSWYYLIDGQYWNKPLVPRVDEMNLEIEKDSYVVGETPRILNSYCKVREAEVFVEWTLVDGQLVDYAPRSTGNALEGCYPLRGGHLAEDVEKIPLFIEAGCDNVFVGKVRAVISGGREVEYAVKTEKFCIEHAEILRKVEEEIKQEN